MVPTLIALALLSANAEKPSPLVATLSRGARVMFVGAHPDDETFVGPLLARAADSGPVLIVCFTRGEGGKDVFTGLQGVELGIERMKELDRAAYVLRADVVFLDFENGFENDIANPKASAETPLHAIKRWRSSGRDPVGEMVKVIRAYRPDVIVTFDPEQGFTGHREHRAVSMVVTEAFKRSDDVYSFPEQFRQGLKVWPTPVLYYAVNQYPDEIKKGLKSVSAESISELVPARDLSRRRKTNYLAVAMEAWSKHITQYGPNALDTPMAIKISKLIEETALVIRARNNQ